jgi:hypothetical protein
MSTMGVVELRPRRYPRLDVSSFTSREFAEHGWREVELDELDADWS